LGAGRKRGRGGKQVSQWRLKAITCPGHKGKGGGKPPMD